MSDMTEIIGVERLAYSACDLAMRLQRLGHSDHATMARPWPLNFEHRYHDLPAFPFGDELQSLRAERGRA